MHPSSMNLMTEFVEKYGLRNAKVVDIGSYDVNGTYRHLFGDNYIGVDIYAGPNVNVIIGSPEWDAVHNVDVVISGQTLEHVKDPPNFMAMIMEILKPGGLVCLIAPSSGPPHDYPHWYKNWPAEDMHPLVAGAGFEILECRTTKSPTWNDTICVARKPIQEKNHDQKTA